MTKISCGMRTPFFVIIAKIENLFVVANDIEVGFGSKIPL
jgi:hypothetical protein